MAHDEQLADRTTGATRRTVLGAGAGALAALAGAAMTAPASAAAPSQAGAETGTARESAAASERGVECVADLR